MQQCAGDDNLRILQEQQSKSAEAHRETSGRVFSIYCKAA